jgi:hypothetical protein
MRVIEKQMIEAVKAGKNWLNGNTRVHHDPVVGGCEVEVYLHGNLIAKRFFRGEDKPGEWKITLAGWNTPTTRSRLNALIQEFASHCCGVGVTYGQARLMYRGSAVHPTLPSYRVGPMNTTNITNTEWVTV